jgi:uncharacterized protein (DUF488 family)
MEKEVSSAGTAGTAQIFTIGHSTRTIEDFIAILKAYGVTCLADIRTVPRSRTNPQFNKDALPESLASEDIKYIHIAGLGGLRKTSADSVNKGWRNDSFRGYADYMQTPEFEESLNGLIELMARETVAIMCAEAVPWRCHRSLVADALTVRGYKAEDIMSATKSEPHKIKPFAKVEGTKITYPPIEEE